MNMSVHYVIAVSLSSKSSYSKHHSLSKGKEGSQKQTKPFSNEIRFLDKAFPQLLSK